MTSRYRHIRVLPPGRFDPRSFRTIDPGRKGYTRLIVGCPKDSYDAESGHCRVGTRLQSVLKENPEDHVFIIAAYDPADELLIGYWKGGGVLTTELGEAAFWSHRDIAEFMRRQISERYPQLLWRLEKRKYPHQAEAESAQVLTLLKK